MTPLQFMRALEKAEDKAWREGYRVGLKAQQRWIPASRATFQKTMHDWYAGKLSQEEALEIILEDCDGSHS